MRNLLIVLTIHDLDEANTASAVFVMTNSALMARIAQARDALWDSIYRGFERFGEDFTGYKVFSEGSVNPPTNLDILPFSKAKQVATEVSASYYHRKQRQTDLTWALWGAGATIIPIEDQELFREASEKFNQLGGKFMVGAEISSDEVASVIEAHNKRIRYWEGTVPKIIGDNLQEGEKGIVIAGAGHDVVSNLPKDITFQFISKETEILWKMDREGKDVFSESGSQYFLETINIQGRSGPERI